MRETLAALGCGLLFGAGLQTAGMTNPAKVLAFLDVTGPWDPTLAFVMAAALGVNAVAYALSRAMSRPLFGSSFGLPSRRDLDAPLIGGAAVFGIGWGLVGLCPGPALADLAQGDPRVAVFVAAMVVGMLLQRSFSSVGLPARRFVRLRARRPDQQHSGAEHDRRAE